MNKKPDTLIETRKDIQQMLDAEPNDRVWRANLICSLWMVNRMIGARNLARRQMLSGLLFARYQAIAANSFAQRMRHTLYEMRAANRGQLNNGKER